MSSLRAIAFSFSKFWSSNPIQATSIVCGGADQAGQVPIL